MENTAYPGKTAHVYRWISDKIRSAEFSPGYYINEYRLSGDLGINRSAVREAINQLIAEGLLEKRENRRVYVVELDGKQVNMLRKFRAVIESGAAYFAALNKNAEDLQSLRAFIDEHRFLVEREYWEGVAKADERFHRTIVEASRNPMIIEAYDRSKIRLRIALSKDPVKNEKERTIPEHSSIVLSIERGEAEKAKNLLWKHLLGDPKDKFFNQENEK